MPVRQRDLDVVPAEIRVKLGDRVELVTIPLTARPTAHSGGFVHPQLGKLLPGKEEVPLIAGLRIDFGKLRQEFDFQRYAPGRRDRFREPDASDGPVIRFIVIRPASRRRLRRP